MADGVEVLVGVVDSGYPMHLADRVLTSRVFVQDGVGLDVQGHGSRVMDAIASQASCARFCVAQVFGAQLRTQGDTVANALHWLIDQGVAVVNISLGVRQDYSALRAVCERALAQGCVLLASAPARGGAVFPASYPGVIRVMGDARCGPGQHSALGLPHADFGACVLPPDGDRRHAGASMASAHLTGRVAAWCAAGLAPELEAVWQALVNQADFRGPERRRC